MFIGQNSLSRQMQWSIRSAQPSHKLIPMPPTRALVAGATGLVGRALVRRLAADAAWTEIHALTRRELPAELRLPRVHATPIDYAELEGGRDLPPAEQVFCALGTTMRQAGSRYAFRRVDLGYPLALARAALAGGASHFLLVSAAGANPRSRIFYSRVKGELEEAVRGLGYRSVTIARPSLLLGARTERRLGEQVGRIAGLVAPPSWRPVRATQVAAALIVAARADRPGTYVLSNAELREAPDA
jgi:uncharacterized protein YbjT (DUF2867 family)